MNEKRTIRVIGTGNASRKPDTIVIGFEMEAENRSYAKAMQLGSDQIQFIQDAAAAAGFEKSELRTTSFSTEADFESVYDEKKHYRSIFRGYICRHSLKLSFDFDLERLNRLLTEIGNCQSVPQFSIRFTVKNPKEVNEELLTTAANDAKERAEILCRASGVKLGALVNIDYSFGLADLFSRTIVEENSMSSQAMKSCSFRADFEPEDIRVSDNATFEWEII